MAYNETKRPAMVPCGPQARDEDGRPIFKEDGKPALTAAVMKDKFGNPRTNAQGQPIKSYAFRHPCIVDGCEKEGSWGRNVQLRYGKPGEWFCEDHKHLINEKGTL